MKRAILVSTFLFMILIPVMSFGQSLQEKKADLLYENMAYSKAVNIYESLYKKYPKKGKYIQRLAYCYDKMLNYKKALLYYSSLIQIEERKVGDYYEYAQLLRIDGNIDEAKKWLEKYIQLAPDDKRAINQYDKLNELLSLKNEVKKIEISEVSGNTRFIDMCPVYYKDRIVYSSAKDSFSMVKNKFEWNNEPFLNLFVTKSNPKNDFKGSTNFSTKLNTNVHEGPACFTSDFKTIYFTRNSSVNGKGKKTANGTNNLKIFISTFDGKNWSDPRDFQYNSNVYSVGHPALSPDNKTLYFVSDMPGGYGETDIYKSEMINGSWSKPVNLGPTINTKGKEMFPYVDKKGTLYFSSDGLPGMAGLDIFAAKEEENGKYLVTNLGAPLNSKYDDFGFIMDTDSLKGYFTSNRPGGAGDDDIYSFSVTAIDLSVKSLRADNREILPNSKIYLISEKGDPITSGQSDQDGKVDFGIKPGAKYKISAENGSMIADIQDVDASSQLIGLQETQEILLKQGYPNLTIEVLDKETGLIIPNALVDISEGDYDHSTLEDNNGIVRMKMNNSTNYTFYTTADEYFSSTVKYSSIDKSPGNYSLTIELEKLSTGKQIALEDLFYDLNKWNIRPDAALVLDKLANILTQNPDVRIEIGSHTDSRGSAESNMTLSQHRSESVMAYLIKKGIAPSRLVAKGYGESQLVNKCADGVICTEEEHQENRRTVIEILNKDIRKVKRGNRNVYYF